MVIQNGSKFKTSWVNVDMFQVLISKLPRNMAILYDKGVKNIHFVNLTFSHKNILSGHSGFNPVLTFLYKPLPKNLVQYKPM